MIKDNSIDKECCPIVPSRMAQCWLGFLIFLGDCSSNLAQYIFSWSDLLNLVTYIVRCQGAAKLGGLVLGFASWSHLG